MADLKSAYRRQKSRAKQRGIPWEFSFHDWCAVWDASGKLEQRGRGSGKYVMARNGDVGPYAPDNVQIVLYEVNARDSRINNPVSTEVLSARLLGKGRGWTFAAGRFQAQLRSKYLGRFKTAAEAESAYRAALEA